jgi:hypothetical protein
VDFQQRAAEIERKRQQRMQRDQDQQTNEVLAQANDIAVNIVNSADIRLDQLLQTGATAGQVVTWNNVTGEWEPADTSGLTDPTTTEGDVIYRDGSGLQRLGIGTAGQRLTVNSTETAPEWADVYALRNVLINGSFAIWQRQSNPATTTEYDDDEYCADRWYVLTQSNPIDAERIDGDTQRYAARLTQKNATAQQFGLAQIVEGANCRHLRGQEVTFLLRAQCNTAETFNVAVLEWGGTEDSVTSDVAASWSGSGLPTLATNVTQAGSTEQTSLSVSTWADVSTTVTLGSSFTNLIIFVWADTRLAQNVTLDLEAAQLERGAIATPFETCPIGMELALCKHYFERFSAAANGYYTIGILDTGNFGNYGVTYFAEKRAVPTLSASAASDFQINDGSTTDAGTSVVFNLIGRQNARFRLQRSTSNCTPGVVFLQDATGTGASYFDIDAEL